MPERIRQLLDQSVPFKVVAFTLLPAFLICGIAWGTTQTRLGTVESTLAIEIDRRSEQARAANEYRSKQEVRDARMERNLLRIGIHDHVPDLEPVPGGEL